MGVNIKPTVTWLLFNTLSISYDRHNAVGITLTSTERLMNILMMPHSYRFERVRSWHKLAGADGKEQQVLIKQALSFYLIQGWKLVAQSYLISPLLRWVLQSTIGMIQRKIICSEKGLRDSLSHFLIWN